MGEGGAVVLSDEEWKERAEIICEKGTQRSKYLRGEIDKYTWVELGSSYVPSELNTACLFAQLEEAETIHQKRLRLWDDYEQNLRALEADGKIELPVIPKSCEHNAHMFYIKTKNIAERTALMRYLKEHESKVHRTTFRLHTSKAGLQFGRFHGEDRTGRQKKANDFALPMTLSSHKNASVQCYRQLFTVFIQIINEEAKLSLHFYPHKILLNYLIKSIETER